ncbi:MAG: hypothetical protein JJE25_10205 [Bacteroidia bacterium]|nr:hypothetical protein [Bacteroidia bacterium]
MKKNTYLKLIVLVAAGAVLTLGSCKKDKATEPDPTPTPTFQSEQDNAEIDGENANIFSFVSSTGDSSADVRSESSAASSCATISVAPLVGWPRTLTIDFGTVNSNGCGDGKSRRGIIYATFNSPWGLHQSGDSVTIWTQNYYVNDIKHEGTRYIIIEDSLTLRVVAVNVRATWPDNRFATWNCNRTRKFIFGFTTPYWWLDDVFEHSGSANGVNRLGESYTLATRTGHPLIQKMNCRWLVQGILDFTPNNLATRTIDYGTGSCDSQVVVTVNNVNYTFYLP